VTAVFIRLLAEEDKGAALERAIQTVRAGGPDGGLVYQVDPTAFGEIPGSPFAYWASERVRRLFGELPRFESDGRTVKQGLATADDFRFVRAWWEVPPQKVVTGGPETTPAEFRQQTFEGKKWVPFAKGGAYSPYYADLHLVVNWERDGEEIKNRINPESGPPYSNVWQLKGTEANYFFRPGLTWPLRTNGLSFRAMPAGAVFGHKGPAAFSNGDLKRQLWILSGLLNSGIVNELVRMLVGRVALAQAFEVGLIQSVPTPTLDRDPVAGELARLASAAASEQIAGDAGEETSHAFWVVGLARAAGAQLLDAYSLLRSEHGRSLDQLYELRADLDIRSATAYGVPIVEDPVPQELAPTAPIAGENADFSDDDDDEEVSTEGDLQPAPLVKQLLPYGVGCAVGRWDVRLATGGLEPPPLPDPFAPLPTCSPGMLTGPAGLPVREPPTGYPLNITRDGILVDDLDHPDDVVARVRAVLDLLWRERAAAIESEACELLGVQELREYFRNPRLFFDDHIKRYSRSRRKAPIYWLLQSSKRSYGLWLYLHRLDADTLFKALERYVGPKLALETQRANDLRTSTGTLPQGPNRRQRERELERQEALVSEIADFKAELERVARLGLAPDLDDGVVLNIAPLYKLVPWREAEKYWKELIAGKYPWASIAKQLRAKGLVR